MTADDTITVRRQTKAGSQSARLTGWSISFDLLKKRVSVKLKRVERYFLFPSHRVSLTVTNYSTKLYLIHFSPFLDSLCVKVCPLI